MGVSARTFVLVGSLVGGCTNVLGIDGDYGLVDAGNGNGAGPSGTGGVQNEHDASASGGTASGGASSGGAASTGGNPSSGGTASGGESSSGGSEPGSGGAPNTGGAPGCGACEPGQKCCYEVCIAPQPVVGCGLEACDPCPAPPAAGISVCSEGQCAIQCNQDYVEMGDECVPDTTLDATTGSGGGPPQCEPNACPLCFDPRGVIRCCRNNDTCGCTFAGAPGGGALYCL
jgi:hypothetical protein